MFMFLMGNAVAFEINTRFQNLSAGPYTVKGLLVVDIIKTQHISGSQGLYYELKKHYWKNIQTLALNIIYYYFFKLSFTIPFQQFSSHLVNIFLSVIHMSFKEGRREGGIPQLLRQEKSSPKYEKRILG